MQRRQFLQLLAMLAASRVLVGCNGSNGDIRRSEAVFNEYRNTDNEQLLVDTHCHFFNGSDLQLKEFISKVGPQEVSPRLTKILNLAGDIIEDWVWLKAPTANKEFNILQNLTEVSSEQQSAQLIEMELQQTDEAHKAVAARVEQLLNQQNKSAMSAERRQELSYAKQLLATSAQFNLKPQNIDTSLQQRMASGVKDTVETVLGLVYSFFQYRSVSAQLYFKTYGDSGDRFDLAITHIVDYDFWLSGKKNQTKSPIKDQIDCSAQLSLLSNGLISYFAPFCPLRQAIWDHAIEEGEDPVEAAGFEPMQMVKYAFEQKGAMGIKLYPPMGFALYGNKEIATADLWGQIANLPPLCQHRRIGQKLDDALDKLYQYCADNHIAIMAHAKISNMSNARFDKIFQADLWRQAVEKYPLSLSLGHLSIFGDEEAKDDPTSDEHLWLAALLDMIEHINHEGPARMYADTSFFSAVINKPALMIERLKALKQTAPQLIEDYMVYGSDWKMLLTEGAAENYLDDYKQVFSEALGDNFALNKILGSNNMNYLNVDKAAVKARLLGFFGEARKPSWL